MINLVLIETYWNVNREIQSDHFKVEFVLIETYWNVNKSDAALKKRSVRY